jgi:hypothetical protein
MPDVLDLIDPVELTEFSRVAADDFDAQSQSLARFFPYRGVTDIMYSYGKGLDLLVDEASFRAFDAESPIGRRAPSARVSGEILPISRKIPLSEYAQLRLRNASSDELIQAHFNDAARLARGIVARVERARAQLLETGKVTINENGVVQEYDADRATSLTVTTLATNDRWSAYSTANPVRDILAWSELIYGLTGLRPTRMLVSSGVMSHLQQVASLASWTGITRARITTAEVVEAIQALAGVTVEVYTPPAGMVTPLNAKKVVLITEGVQLGASLFGIPVEASEPEYAGLSVQPGIVAGTWKEKDPVTPWTKAVALALPIMASPDTTLCAQVVA